MASKKILLPISFLNNFIFSSVIGRTAWISNLTTSTRLDLHLNNCANLAHEYPAAEFTRFHWRIVDYRLLHKRRRFLHWLLLGYATGCFDMASSWGVLLHLIGGRLNVVDSLCIASPRLLENVRFHAPFWNGIKNHSPIFCTDRFSILLKTKFTAPVHQPTTSKGNTQQVWFKSSWASVGIWRSLWDRKVCWCNDMRRNDQLGEKPVSFGRQKNFNWWITNVTLKEEQRKLEYLSLLFSFESRWHLF